MRRPGFDPVLAAVAFSFKVDCPSDFDCAPDDDVRAAQLPAPHIDYLAKDYASFRRLMLDRLAVLDAGVARAQSGRPRRHRSSSCSPTSATN